VKPKRDAHCDAQSHDCGRSRTVSSFRESTGVVVIQHPALPRLAETCTMFPLNQEGASQHLRPMRDGSTLCQRSRVHEIVGCAFTRHPHPGELGRR
jgi:hypothetical protein